MYLENQNCDKYTKGPEMKETTSGPINVRGTTPGNSRWSYCNKLSKYCIQCVKSFNLQSKSKSYQLEVFPVKEDIVDGLEIETFFDLCEGADANVDEGDEAQNYFDRYPLIHFRFLHTDASATHPVNLERGRFNKQTINKNKLCGLTFTVPPAGSLRRETYTAMNW